MVGLFALMFCLLCFGCGDGLSGSKYAEDGGFHQQMEFKPGNKVTLSYLGTTYAGTYSVDGDQITIDCSPFGKVVVTRGKDGALSGVPPLNTTLKKVSS
jgi:hypothetical protein